MSLYLRPSTHSDEDQDFIENLSGRVLMGFRNFVYSEAFVRSHAGLFLDNQWIDVNILRRYVHDGPTATDRDGPTTAPVKIENLEPTVSALPHVKIEPGLVPQDSLGTAIRTRIHRYEGHDVLEILSDSDEAEYTPQHAPSEPDDTSSDLEVSDLIRPSSRSSSIFAPMDIAGTLFADPIVAVLKTSDPDDNEDPDDADHFDDSPLQESDTIWADDYIKSFVQVGTFRITPKVTVRRQEYITEIPSAWPVFRETTAIHLDLSNPKFNIKNKLTTELHSPDYLIYNKVSFKIFSMSLIWINASPFRTMIRTEGNTGSGDNSGMVVMSPGEPPVKCRRARRTCAGTVACENLDRALIEVERYELDPTSRNAIFAAQQNTRRTDANT
ncbi:hypothetical protein C8J57DRAFT_1517555 [Mycena rebaudengoi]|nr:hypothetical protein C8J57DRAFT_1517555 [Mycena rebaudengoi]